MKVWFFVASVVCFIILVKKNGQAQNEKWELEITYEKLNFYLLKGKIDEKYPITMKLFISPYGACNNDNLAVQWWPNSITGWYYYDKIEAKIPLVGLYWYQPRGKNIPIKLFVPESPFDSIQFNTCEMEKYKEVFINPSNNDFNNLQWQMRGDTTFKEVALETLNEPLQVTNANLVLKIKDIPYFEANITELADSTGKLHLGKIDKLEVINSSFQGNHFHILLKLHSGFTREAYTYIAYIKINSQFELENFQLGNIYNSWKGDGDHIVTFDPNFPEKGISVKKRD